MTIRPVSILIPARMESNRLPGKMLLMVRENTPLIYETYLNVLAAIEFSHNPELYDVHVTTDSLQIESYLKSRNVSVILTRPEHEGGISRCYEASRNLSSKYFLIIQGDEPLVMSDMLDKLSAYHLNTSSHLVVCSTLATKLDSSQNCVRIVVSNDYRALYMTRSILPSNKNILTHLGVYGFSKSALSAYSKYNCSLSILESSICM